MRIGFDAKRAAQNRTGLGNYSRFVVRILSQAEPANDYHLYTPNARRTPYLGEIPTLGALHLHTPCQAVWRRLGSLWRVWGVASDLRRDAIELYHGLSNELPLTIGRAGCRSVVTIHDLIFIHCPEYYHPIDRMIYNYKFRRACRVADRVIAVSEFTKRELLRHRRGQDRRGLSGVRPGLCRRHIPRSPCRREPPLLAAAALRALRGQHRAAQKPHAGGPRRGADGPPGPAGGRHRACGGRGAAHRL